MIDAGSIQRELAGEGFEALVIDADLATSKDTAAALRYLGPNRPVIVVGSGNHPPAEFCRRDDTFLSRPVGREMFVFAVIMALAEGRPARQSPRRLVARLQATVDGAPAKLIDVSSEGIRLELRSNTAPPSHRW